MVVCEIYSSTTRVSLPGKVSKVSLVPPFLSTHLLQRTFLVLRLLLLPLFTFGHSSLARISRLLEFASHNDWFDQVLNHWSRLGR